MNEFQSQKNYGTAIVANDKVLNWLVPFLESYFTTNPSLPLYLIPYDDNLKETRRVADIYGAHVVDVDTSKIDALAKRLHPLAPGRRRRLRKLLSLTLPLDAVIYIDIDVVVFRDLSKLFSLLDPGKTDFIVASKSNDYVFNKKQHKFSFLDKAFTFNDGFFVTSNSILSVADFEDVIRTDEKSFHEVRHRGGLFSQPLVNFVTHRRGLKVVPLYDRIADASGETYFKVEGIVLHPDGPTDASGRRIYFAHWPGLNGLPTTQQPLDIAWREFARSGASRTGLLRN